MKRFVYILGILLSTGTYAQYNIDVGFHLGAANYLGEMGGKEDSRRDFVWDMKLRETRWAAGVFGRYKFNPYLSASGAFMYGRIQGADELSTNPGRRGRNLHFRNDIFEFSGRGELYVYNLQDVGNRGRYRLDMKTYVHAGVSYAYHSPKAQHPNTGAWTKLRPLATEGVDYEKWILGIPVGGGLCFTHRRQHRYGWEFGWRMLFTDYLDDVSSTYVDVTGESALFANRTDAVAGQTGIPPAENYNVGSKRGDATHNDTYMFMTLYYSYVMKGPNSFYRAHYGWLSGRRGRYRRVRAKF